MRLNDRQQDFDLTLNALAHPEDDAVTQHDDKQGKSK